MADWGLYAALRGQDNWAQRRADEQMEMQVLQKHAAREEKKTQQAMMAEEGINKYLDEMANIDVLPEDQERIKEVERQARHNIVKGIAQNNGDLSRYVSSGGITDLHQYKNSILQSGEVKTALSNKENMAKIIADKQAGNRWFKPIEVNIPQTDEEGNELMDATGQPVMERRMVDVDEQLSLFKNGVINNLGYNGSEKKVKLNAMAFKGAFKDDKNKQGPNEVTTSDIVFHAMEAGASEEYANHLADSYKERYDAGMDPWKWKAQDQMEVALMNEKLRKAKAGPSKKSGGVTTLNQRSPQLLAMADSGQEYAEKILPKERDFWMNSKGINYDSKTNTHRPSYAIGGVDALTGKNYDLSNAVSVRPTSDYVTKNGEVYLLTDVVYDADSPQANNPHYEDLFGYNQLDLGEREGDAQNAAKNNWREMKPEDAGIVGDHGIDDNVWVGQVLIPVTEEMKSGVFVDGMNKMLGHKSTQEGHYGSATNEDYQQLTQQQIMAGAQQYGVTPEEYMAAMQYNSER